MYGVCTLACVYVCVSSRYNPMGLIIALDDNNQAAGELFWDDGDSRGIVCETVSSASCYYHSLKAAFYEYLVKHRASHESV